MSMQQELIDARRRAQFYQEQNDHLIAQLAERGMETRACHRLLNLLEAPGDESMLVQTRLGQLRLMISRQEREAEEDRALSSRLDAEMDTILDMLFDEGICPEEGDEESDDTPSRLLRQYIDENKDEVGLLTARIADLEGRNRNLEFLNQDAERRLQAYRKEIGEAHLLLDEAGVEYMAGMIGNRIKVITSRNTTWHERQAKQWKASYHSAQAHCDALNDCIRKTHEHLRTRGCPIEIGELSHKIDLVIEKVREQMGEQFKREIESVQATRKEIHDAHNTLDNLGAPCYGPVYQRIAELFRRSQKQVEEHEAEWKHRVDVADQTIREFVNQRNACHSVLDEVMGVSGGGAVVDRIRTLVGKQPFCADGFSKGRKVALKRQYLGFPAGEIFEITRDCRVDPMLPLKSMRGGEGFVAMRSEVTLLPEGV